MLVVVGHRKPGEPGPAHRLLELLRRGGRRRCITSLSSGTITWPPCTAENSSAPVISPASSSTSPWRVDSCTIDCTSSSVKEEVTSSFGSIRSSSEDVVGGPVQRGNHRLHQPWTRTSAAERAATRPCPPPTPRCSSAPFRQRSRAGRSPPTAPRRRPKSGRPHAERPATPPAAAASRWWIAGSATFRISSEQTVMPSWAQASIRETCSIAHRVVLRTLGTGFRQRLDLAAAGGHDGELRADEEGVADQQHDQPENTHAQRSERHPPCRRRAVPHRLTDRG